MTTIKDDEIKREMSVISMLAPGGVPPYWTKTIPYWIKLSPYWIKLPFGKTQTFWKD